jgi:hypothetical protein
LSIAFTQAARRSGSCFTFDCDRHESVADHRHRAEHEPLRKADLDVASPDARAELVVLGVPRAREQPLEPFDQPILQALDLRVVLEDVSRVFVVAEPRVEGLGDGAERRPRRGREGGEGGLVLGPEPDESFQLFEDVFGHAAATLSARASEKLCRPNGVPRRPTLGAPRVASLLRSARPLTPD